ncbi:MAG: RHS repeat-associated core domain-containing protein [Woeseiaceae bacterium]
MEIESGSSNTDYRHYLSDVAILTKTGSLNDANPGIRYLLRDRLGSLATIADKSGLSVETHGYDAFGKPRLGNWSDKAPPIHGSGITDRGFTEHEHLDDWQLIHMNGRAYDYNLGRFLSIDPIIQSPGNSQSMNPFSYIMNNPLSGTDPSGYAAVDEECQSKPVACRAVMAAEYGTSNTGLIGNFGMPGYRGGLLARFNGASSSKHGVVTVESRTGSADGSGSQTTEINDLSASQRQHQTSANGDWADGKEPEVFQFEEGRQRQALESLAPVLLPDGSESETKSLARTLVLAAIEANTKRSAPEKLRAAGMQNAFENQSFGSYVFIDKAFFSWNEDKFEYSEASIRAPQGLPIDKGSSTIVPSGGLDRSDLFVTVVSQGRTLGQSWHQAVIHSSKNGVYARNVTLNRRPVLVITPEALYLFGHKRSE